MIILDTNVISEPMRLAPDAAAAAWMRRQDLADVFLTAISEAEMRYGIERLPAGRRREILDEQITATFERDFKGRVLAFESRAAREYGEIVARLERSGREIKPLDAQIAAIARFHAAPLATRNVKHFVGCGVELIDPWASGR